MHDASYIEASLGQLPAQIRELARTASIEIRPSTPLGFLERVSPGTRIHITDFSDEKKDADRQLTIALSQEFLEKGLIPVPHIAARRIKNRDELETVTTRMAGIGVTHVMLVDGGSEPAGEFKSAMDILHTGLIRQFNDVAVAGHPGAKSFTSPSRYQAGEALRLKNEYARQTGQPLRIVTQLGFDPDPVLKWSNAINRQGNTLPLHIGIAAPAKLKEKTHYAQICGIDIASAKPGSGALKLLETYMPDTFVTTVAKSCLKNNGHNTISGLHFFAFGVMDRTIGFINSLKDGDFVMKSGDTGFELQLQPD